MHLLTVTHLLNAVAQATASPHAQPTTRKSSRIACGATRPAGALIRGATWTRTTATSPSRARSSSLGSATATSRASCGASNTFDSWFSTGSGSGEVEDHKLTELVTLMKTYTTSISETLEENFIEATQVRLPPSPKPPAAQPTTTAARTPPADATRHAATRRRAALPRAHATVPTAARPWTSAPSPSPAPMAPIASPSPGKRCCRMTRRPT